MTTTQLQKMEIKQSIYTLTKDWFDWCKENREKNNPTLSALYFWTIQKCNSLGWVEKFGLPTDEAMHVLGIGSYNTYKKNLLQLEEIGFIHIVELSKNQWTSNIIALSKFDKAMMKHLTKQVQSIEQSNDEALDKAGSKQVEYNKTNKTNNTKKTNNTIKEDMYIAFAHLSLSFSEFEKLKEMGYSKTAIDETIEKIENYRLNKNYKSLFITLKNWLKKDFEKQNSTVFANNINNQNQSTVSSKSQKDWDAIVNWGIPTKE